MGIYCIAWSIQDAMMSFGNSYDETIATRVKYSTQMVKVCFSHLYNEIKKRRLDWCQGTAGLSLKSVNDKLCQVPSLSSIVMYMDRMKELLATY